MSEPSCEFDPIDELADAFLERYRRGERPSLSEYTEKHPELAERIRDVFHALVVMEEIGTGKGQGTGTHTEPFGSGATAPRRLGDFVLLRRVGAGGMGIVYEAEHASLKSRMALKVMHPRFRADQAYVRRFQTEARSAAKLHHTNIVSVFGYGEQDGVCYYAMQYIVGVGLERVLEDVRRLRAAASGDGGVGSEGGANGATSDAAADLLTAVSRGLLSGQFLDTSSASPVAGKDSTRTALVSGAAASIPGGDRIGPDRSAAAPALGRAEADSSSFAGQAGSIYFREVARLGAQVADALEYAHRQGVIHRDIKPSNLLLDIRGNVWVTDFGLAKLVEGDELTQSHDLVGTLRFMAPERFRGVTDPLGDVYSLGATLYELLTLKPAFGERDQARLIDQIAHESPVPLRQHDHRIPRDLETLVQKALAKEPRDRFATAGAFGDELQRYLESRPIHSRPVGPMERLWRWCKRSPGLAGASIAAAVLTVTMLIGLIVAAWTFRAQRDQIRHAERQTRETLFESLVTQARATRFSRQVGQRFESLGALERAAGIARELALPPDRFDRIRDEAIACLALPDLKTAGRVIKQPAEAAMFCFDSTMNRYALRLWSGTILVRAVDDDHEIARFQARGDRRILVFAFSPDGRYLATTHFPGYALTVWNVDQNTITVAEPGPVEGTSARFSPDSRRIALAHPDGEVLIYDLDSGRLARLQSGQVGVHDLAFRPDGIQIAVTNSHTDHPTCRILDVASGRLVATLALRSASSVAWSPDCKSLATPGDDAKIDLWDVPSGVPRARLEGFTNAGLHAMFHPAGTLLASQGWENRLRLWDASSGQQVLSVSGSDPVGPTFSPNGRFALWLEDRLTTYQVDPALEYRAFVHISSELSNHQRPSIRRDNQLMAMSTRKGIVLWDLARGTECAILPIGPSWHAMFEATGELITSGPIGVWRWPVELEPDRGKFRIGPPRQLPFSSAAGTIAEDLSGQIVARDRLSYADIFVSGHLRKVGPLDDCRSVAVSPDGRWLATGSHHKGAQIWRVLDQEKEAELPIDYGTKVAFSPDGKWLMTEKPPCRLWATGTWTLAREIGGSGLCFSLDGRLVAVLDATRVVRMVEVVSGRVIARLESPEASDVGAAGFAPDGSLLALATNNSPAVRVWDLCGVRRSLVALGLDGDAPPFSGDVTAGRSVSPLPSLQFDPGPLAGKIPR